MDRAVERVLRQKGELGLLDADWSPTRRAAAAERSTSTTPESPGAGPRAGGDVRRAAAQRRHACRSPPGRRGRGGRPARRRPRARCSAATRSRCTSASTTPTSRSGVDDPDRARARCAPNGRLRRRATRRAARCSAATTREHRRGGRGRGGRRRLRGGARRPGRPVRPGHLRRGLRRRRPAAARPAGGAARGAAGDRHAGGAGAARRPARTSCRRQVDRLAAVGVRVLPGRGGRRRRSPRCSPAGRTRPAGCRSASRGAGASQPSTYLAAPLGAAQRGRATSTRRRCSPFGHGLSYAPVELGPRESRSRGRAGRPTAVAVVGSTCTTRTTGQPRRWFRSTCTTVATRWSDPICS